MRNGGAGGRRRLASGVWDTVDRSRVPPEGDMFDRAAARIAHVRRLGTISTACHVGAIVVEEIFHGDIEALRDKGRKDASLRGLASHPKTNLSVSTLSRAVAVFQICQRMPGFREPKHLEVGHLYAVASLPDLDQERLLRIAEVERWSREKLVAKVSEIRPAPSKRHKPSPILRYVATVRRAISRPLPDIEIDLADESTETIEEVLNGLDRLSTELRAWLSSARSRPRSVSR